MESKIQKHIIDYFSFFDEYHNTAKTCLRDCQNYAATINKLIKRCKNIKEANVIGSPLEEIEGLQSKLCAILHNHISATVHDIKCKQSTLEDLFEKLYNKNKILRDNCRVVDFNSNSKLVKGSPYQPPLRELLVFADDTITFASHICAQIDSALNILSFKKLDTASFGEHFQYPVNWNRRVTEIITYTAFLSKNEI